MSWPQAIGAVPAAVAALEPHLEDEKSEAVLQGRRSDDPPAIARIAGLPAASVEELSSGLADLVRERLSLHGSLEAARDALVNRLYTAVYGASTELRRVLLAVKRDCFNGRPLSRHQVSPHWQELLDRAGDLAAHVLALEEQVTATQAKLEATYWRERERERAHLVSLLDDTALLRGIALASPLLVGAAERLRKPAGDHGRRERKAEISLLRYLSRAAFKTSPFSTLTRLGLATVHSNLHADRSLRFTGPWRERSLVRLKRYLLTQYRQLLLRYPPFLEGLEIRLNDSVTEIAPGRFRFLRPSSRDFNESSGAMQYTPASMVRLDLHGPVAAWLMVHLTGELGLPYRTLLTALECKVASAKAGDVKATVDRLLTLGFLQARLPWPSDEIRLEHEMVRHLKALPPDERLESFLVPFVQLIAVESSYAVTPTPGAAVAEVDRRLQEMWEAGRSLFGLGDRANYVHADKCDLFEDVFLLPQRGTTGAVLQIDQAKALDLVHTAAPLISFLNLYNNRYDFLHSLAAFATERWPGEREVMLLDVFDAAQPLWRSYLQFGVAMRKSGNWRDTFDPQGLPELEALRSLRQTVWEEVCRCVKVGETDCQINPEDLADALTAVPALYKPTMGGCLFLQPADAKGDTWVLNHLFDGTGRYASRYTSVMDEEMRRRYTDHLLACSQFEAGGVQFELLDLMCAQGDTLNIHAVQTPRVLEVPGEDSNLPEVRRVSLRDLRVRFGRPGDLPTLLDSAGRHYLPVHLGGTNLTYMPVLLKFLTLFGPGEYKNAYPPRKLRSHGDVSVYDPLWMGRILLLRRRWTVIPQILRGQIEKLDEPRAFEVVNRWRLEIGIPDRVFVIERLAKKLVDEFYKPQYIDFTSPSFVEVFRTVLQSQAESLTIEEMCPTPAAYPADSEGKRWAVELQLDTLVLGRGRSFTIEYGARRAPASAALPAEDSSNRATDGSKCKE